MLASLIAACGGGSSAGSAGGGTIGQSITNSDGTVWFVEQNQGGAATQLFIDSVFWGRLVDISDNTGELLHRDFLIGEDIRTDGVDYQLDINSITEQASLTILHTAGTAAYAAAFDRLDLNLGPILPKADVGATPPFSFVPRNATISVRFSDAIDPATLNKTTVRIQVGNPPSAPFEARLVLDPNFGTEIGGQFFPTRILIDPTISEVEASGSLLPLNSLGLPASKTNTLPNVSIRIPTQLDFGAGQFQLLSNPTGHSLTNFGNGPTDFSSSTVDVVRAMRSGGDAILTGDSNNGFLLDLNPPRLVGSQPVTVLSVTPVVGSPTEEFVVSFQFASPFCASSLVPGDVIQFPNALATVSLPTLEPVAGFVSEVRLQLLTGTSFDLQLGAAQVLSTFSFAAGDLPDCFVSFSPLPGIQPSGGVSPDAQVVLRFSEPMDPSSLQPFDTFTITNSPSGIGITSFVVGEVIASSDLKEFRFEPQLPFGHEFGLAENYFVNLAPAGSGVVDLAGNALAEIPGQVLFTVDAQAATEANGSLVLRFNQPNEDGDTDGGISLNEYTGQFLQDTERGLIKARPVEHFAAIADSSQAVPGNMNVLPTGLQTPLSPLGSRMMCIYRYFDLGLSLTDISSYNLDVTGLNWAPQQGQVQSDNYEEFEVNLAHSNHLPDEARNTGLLPVFPQSGLLQTTFAANVLNDPINGQVTVHAKPLGYFLDPLEKFIGGSGTTFMPYPINRNLPEEQWLFYTFRDTSLLATGAPNGLGIPTQIELDRNLISGDTTVFGQFPSDVAFANDVPSIGLPLLVEFKCYPSDTGIGLNALASAIAINSSSLPTFRVFSTGGSDPSGTPVSKNPDTEISPSGGLNANPALTIPLGSPTPPRDNAFYFGQLDLVVRVSRTFTRWLDTGDNLPVYLPPVLEPRPEDQPLGTSLTVDYRGATGMPNTAAAVDNILLNADALNVYGDRPPAGAMQLFGSVFTKNAGIQFKDGVDVWTDNLKDLDRARYFQARFTFIGNTVTGLTPELSAFGVAFLRNS